MPNPTKPSDRHFRLSGDLPAGAEDWVYLPIDVPDGVERISVRYDYDHPDVAEGALANACDMGIFDTRGIEIGRSIEATGFRGWSGGARTEFTIGTDSATPGYLAGPIEPGRWHLVLGPYQVAAAGLHYDVSVTLEFGPGRAATEPDYPPPAVAGRGPDWYRGDCHLHSVYSDGRRTPAEIALAAREAGCDFIVSTEHNTPAAHGVWGPLAGDDLLIMTGEEVTTRNGHLLALGLDPGSWIDWRFRAVDDRLGTAVAQIHDHHGLAVAAHPHSGIVAGRWKFGFADIDGIEVWNGPWNTANESAVDTWDAQLTGPAPHRWCPAMGNSDAHAAPNAVGLPQTVVFADSLSRNAILAAIRAGRSWIAESAATTVDFSIVSDDGSAGIGERLVLPRDLPVQVRADIAGVPGGLARLITDEGQTHQQPLDADGLGSVRWTTTAAVTGYVRLEVRRPRPDGSLGSGTAESAEPPLGPMAALTNPIFLEAITDDGGPDPAR